MYSEIAISLSVVTGLLVALAWSRRLIFRTSIFRNLPGPPSASFTKGNVRQLMHRHSGEWTKHLVESYGPACKLSAPFGREWLHIYDPKALYNIAIKDQDGWEKNTGRLNLMLIGPGLLTTEGHQHRKQRKMLTPVFSVAYLRDATPLFYETSYKLRDALKANVGSASKEVDVISWTGRTALELLGQGALGYSFDPLTEDVSDEFAESVKSFFGALNAVGVVRAMLAPLPARLRRIVVQLIASKRVQRLKDIVNAMNQKSTDIINEKKRALQKGDEALLDQVGEGKDIMSILLKANLMSTETERLSDEELTAQISTFILAGMDTTSNATSRLLHLLALNPTIQTRLREELLDAQAGQEVSYDRLVELPYLDAVCRETLRLYGPVRSISRRALKDTVLPLHEPIRGSDGSLLSDVAAPKGTVVVLNLWACNTNKALWGEDAYEWKPERWLAPLPRALEDARIPGVYSNLMSFYGGGRSCIGFKYAQLELKVVLSVLVANFKFALSDKVIVWNNAGVAYPTVGNESKKPEMPLKVSVIRGESSPSD